MRTIVKLVNSMKDFPAASGESFFIRYLIRMIEREKLIERHTFQIRDGSVLQSCFGS